MLNFLIGKIFLNKKVWACLEIERYIGWKCKVYLIYMLMLIIKVS